MPLDDNDPAIILRTALAEMRDQGPEAYPGSDAANIFWNLDCVEEADAHGVEPLLEKS